MVYDEAFLEGLRRNFPIHFRLEFDFPALPRSGIDPITMHFQKKLSSYNTQRSDTFLDK